MSNWIKSGVYKITNPVGQVYVGSTVNLVQRFSYHRGLHCKTNTKLYKSLLKYGVESHTFEVIEYCDKEVLEERERHYGDLFGCFSESTGLNSRLPKIGEVCGVSEDYRRKSSIRVCGKNNPFYKKQHRADTIEYLRKVNSGENNPMYGVKFDDETKEKAVINNPNTNPLLDLETGIYYISITEAALARGLPRETLRGRVKRGQDRYILLK